MFRVSWLAVEVSKGSQRRLQVDASWGRDRRRRSQSRQAAMPINCCLFSSSQQSVNTSITWPLQVPWCVNFNSSNNSNNNSSNNNVGNLSLKSASLSRF